MLEQLAYNLRQKQLCAIVTYGRELTLNQYTVLWKKTKIIGKMVVSFQQSSPWRPVTPHVDSSNRNPRCPESYLAKSSRLAL